jgi:hypothetical protein
MSYLMPRLVLIGDVPKVILGDHNGELLDNFCAGPFDHTMIRDCSAGFEKEW